MIAIKTENLTKKYKDITAVDGLNLEIMRGELFSLLGVNGAGKSTTIRMLSTLVLPSEGDAWLLGKSIVSESDAVKAFIAVSPQESAVAPKLSVKENLEFICGCYGFTKEKTRLKVDELLSALSLSEFKDKSASKLSGGYQRRLSLAMALIGEPEILFLDEPTLGLDVLSRAELWDIIRTLKGRVTIILTTHYMEEAEALSDRVGIMNGGRLIIVDTPEKIKEKTGAEKFEDAFIKVVRGEVK